MNIAFGVLVLLSISSLCLFSDAVQKVKIFTMGYLYPTALPSLAFNFPALDIATRQANEIYRGQISFELKQITDKSLLTCPGFSYEATDLVSRWYYASIKGSPNDSDLIVIINPGL